MALTVTRYSGSRASAGTTTIYTIPAGKLAKIVFTQGMYRTAGEAPNSAYTASGSATAVLKVGGAAVLQNAGGATLYIMMGTLDPAVASTSGAGSGYVDPMFCEAGGVISAVTFVSGSAVKWDFLVFLEDI